MKTRTHFALLLSLCAATPFAACGDDDDDNPQEQTDSQESTLHTGIPLADDGSYTLDRKTGYGDDWIYVNLSSMDTVAVSEQDHKTDLSWDIAFNRYNIRTNSGTSGSGLGGAFKTDATKMADVASAPSKDNFVADTLWMITKTPTMSTDGVIEMESSANPILSKAISIIVKNGPPDYDIAENVFLIRSADGNKIFKFKTISFFNAKGQSGYYCFMAEEL